jgi:predicted ribosomally synthesized peptide with SipW-like signal peptide
MTKNNAITQPLRSSVAPLRRIVTTIGIFATAIVLAISAAGGTYAVWNSRTVINASSITSGSTALTINDVSSYAVPDMDNSKLLPGRSSVSGVITLKNTGYTPISISLAPLTFSDPSSVLASNLTVVLRQAATCEVTPFGTTPSSFVSPIVLARGQTTTMCLEARLSASAPASVQAASTSFSVPLNARQVR